MRWVALVALCACGGLELVEGGDGGIANSDASVIHGQLCTQSSCASSVSTLTTFGIVGSEEIALPGLAVGGGFVYCSTSSQLVRAPLTGGTMEAVAPSTLTYAIVADETNVYWSQSDPPAVFMRAHAGGMPLALPVSNAPIALNVFLDTTSIYWTESGDLASVPIAGGTRTTYAAASEFAALDGARMFIAPCSTSIDLGATSAPPAINSGYGVTVDDTACYWVVKGVGTGPQGHDAISMRPLDGGASIELASGPTTQSAFNGERMVVDSDAVYFRSLLGTPSGTLSRVPRGGGSVVNVTTDAVLAYTITSDTVFWVTLDNGSVSIKRMPKYH